MHASSIAFPLGVMLAVIGCGRIGFVESTEEPIMVDDAGLPSSDSGDGGPSHPNDAGPGDATLPSSKDTGAIDSQAEDNPGDAPRDAPDSTVPQDSAPPAADTNPPIDSAPLDTGSVPVDTGVADASRVADSGNGIDSMSAPETFTIGGTVSGLPPDTTVALQDNGGDNLTIDNNGSFQFMQSLGAGQPYAVTLLTVPEGTTCAVSNGSGVVAGADITNIEVTCVLMPTFTIGGTVSGLAGGDSLPLQDNGGDTVMVTRNGSFTFPTALVSGASYKVTVVANPSVPVAQTCVVGAATGTVSGANVTSVTVTCTTQCGFADEPCCAGDMCTVGTCIANVCTCGAISEPCCAGNTCPISGTCSLSGTCQPAVGG